MNILYIHQYFATPKSSTGTRSYEFARRWAAADHNVRMLTTVAQLSGEDLADAKGFVFKRIMIDGIDVCAINLPYSQKMGFATRCLCFFGFALIASVYVLFVKRPDVVYATSTPLTVGLPALFAKWIRRIPFVFEVRDQWPEVPIELGIIRNKLLIRLLLGLEKTIYKYSSAIVAASPGQAEGIKEICDESKIIQVVPNSCDTDKFSPDIEGSHIRDKYGWNNKVVFLHAGAMGQANSLHFVIEAAEKLRTNDNILFVLVGDGNEKLSLQERVKDLGLHNVQIIDSRPKTELPELFAAADVGMVIFGKYPILEHNSANKFFDALAAGKPVLLNYSGWQREIIEANNAGAGCRQYNLDEFIQKVDYIANHPQKIKQMGDNARKLAFGRFNRDALASEVLDLVISV